MTRRTLHAALLAGFLTLAGAPLAAQTVFTVDPLAGTDVAGPGPFKTIGFALTQTAPGDIVELLDTAVYGTNVGSGQNGEVLPIQILDQRTIRAAVGTSPVVDGDGAIFVFQITAAITGATSLENFIVQDCITCVRALGTVPILGFTLEDMIFRQFTVAGVQFRFDAGTDNSLALLNCDFDGPAAAFGLNLTVTRDTGAPPQPAVELDSLLVEDCNFISSTIGLSLSVENAALVRDAVIQRCTFNGLAGRAIDVVVNGGSSGGAAITSGGIRECTVTNCVEGLRTRVTDGSIALAFKLLRNRITGHTGRGILIEAEGAGTNPTNSTVVQGNRVAAPAGGGADGLVLFSRTSAGGPSLVDGPVAYNHLDGNFRNVRIETDSTGGPANITSVFLGNVIINALDDGIQFFTTGWVLGQPNAAPNFGAASPADSGRNTIQGNAGHQMELSASMQNTISAQRNFWNKATQGDILASINQNGAPLLPDVTGFLADLLAGAIAPGQIATATAAPIAVTANPVSSRFVDNPDDGAMAEGQITVLVGTNPVVATVSADGSTLTFTTPSLLEGTYPVTIANPGLQQLVLSLVVAVATGSGSSGSCVVATAAHGGYDAEEVRVLRRLRDEYFFATAAGRSLVSAYYDHGPAVARFIEPRPWARASTRAALGPPVAVSRALLGWNRGARLLAGAGLLGLFFLLRRRRR